MFLIIDGSSLLTTYYYGTLPAEVAKEKDTTKQEKLYHLIRHTRNGIYTNAIAGTLRCILNIIRYQKPSHLAVVLDRSRDTFRRKLYPQYKANRPDRPEPLEQQMRTLKDILTKIGIRVLDSSTYEADDLAASIVKKFESPYEEICVLSKDHDWLQMVGEHTSAWMLQSSEDKVIGLRNKHYASLPTRRLSEYINIPNKTFRFDTDIVYAEEGVYPYQIPDLKALTGDSADNIPGVSGIGPAVATPLLGEYKTVEGIYAAIDGCGNDKEQEDALAEYWKIFLGIRRNPLQKLKDGKENAILSKQLATVVTDIPVLDSMAAYECHVNRKILLSALSHFGINELQEIAEEL